MTKYKKSAFYSIAFREHSAVLGRADILGHGRDQCSPCWAGAVTELAIADQLGSRCIGRAEVPETVALHELTSNI